MRYRTEGQWQELTFILFAIISLLVVASGIAGVALMKEGSIAAANRAFTTAGERALQLDRYGFTFAELENPEGLHGSIDPEHASEQINCQRDISTYSANDPSFRAVYSVVETLNPISVYLIYSGDPPDFSAVFSSANARQLFDRQEKKYSGEPAEKFYNGESLREYDRYIAGRSLSWQSKQCKDFSYTHVWED